MPKNVGELPHVPRKIVVGKSRVPKPAQLRMEAARERQLQALELRKARVTYSDIAKALDFASASGAKAAVQAAMQRQEYDLGKEVIILDLQSLDELQMRCTEQLRKGDLFQVDRILRIMNQRYQIAGIGARTVEEVQAMFGITPEKNAAAITNNGVMIVSGTESDFVKSMMQATGVDINSPAAQTQLKAIEARKNPDTTVMFPVTENPKKKIKIRKTKNGKVVRSSRGRNDSHSSAEATTPHPPVPVLVEDEIVDAEIIEE